MISADDVVRLAGLARLSLTSDEVEKLRGEIETILSYVDTIQKVALPKTPSAALYLDVENVTRADEHPHEPGQFTEELLGQAPRRDGGYLKVKKILS